MRFIITLTIFTVVTDSSWTQTTKDPLLDLRKSTTEKQMEELGAGSQYGNTDLKALWVYRPPPYVSALNEESHPRPVVFKPRHSVTKLAKTLMYGIDPFFSKVYFEFERRPKPVTLVAVRKNRVFPRKTVKSVPETTANVAELQSPYNDVSSLWVETPAET